MATPIDIARKSHVYGARATTRQLLADIAQLRDLDKLSEKQQRRWTMVALAGVLLTVGSIIIGVVTGFSIPLLVVGLLLLSVGALITGIVMSVLHGRMNYDNKRYEMLNGVLDLLGRDTHPDAVLHVRMDLRNPNHQQKFRTTGQAGPWKVRYFEDPWMNVQGRLLDGTAYQLTMIEDFQSRSRWKRSASGKNKHKTKTKTATTWVLRLRTKPDKHPYIGQLSPDVAGAVQLPPWVTLKSVEAKGNTLVLKVNAKTAWHVAPTPGRRPSQDGLAVVAMMFLSLYQVVNLSRRLAKAQDKGTM